VIWPKAGMASNAAAAAAQDNLVSILIPLTIPFLAKR
jgi:hypothetical protein